ncbi:MAG: twin-arginine translocation signal domain-containing protein, partial [Candidatus Latescibacteria bacterium]|nr:twin-arginine translocation signal domain-containing protein [Candidatus Latescibacterota bacterium]
MTNKLTRRRALKAGAASAGLAMGAACSQPEQESSPQVS